MPVYSLFCQIHLCVFWRKEPKLKMKYTPLHRYESKQKNMKSASGQRHPGEKQSPGEEKADRSNAARSGGSREEKVHKARCSDCSDNASKNCADSKDRSLFSIFHFNSGLFDLLCTALRSHFLFKNLLICFC